MKEYGQDPCQDSLFVHYRIPSGPRQQGPLEQARFLTEMFRAVSAPYLAHSREGERGVWAGGAWAGCSLPCWCATRHEQVLYQKGKDGDF